MKILSGPTRSCRFMVLTRPESIFLEFKNNPGICPIVLNKG
jgi:hypothetical protein